MNKAKLANVYNKLARFVFFHENAEAFQKIQIKYEKNKAQGVRKKQEGRGSKSKL